MAGIFMQQIDIIYRQKWFTEGKDESKSLNKSLSLSIKSVLKTNKDDRDKLFVTER